MRKYKKKYVGDFFKNRKSLDSFIEKMYSIDNCALVVKENIIYFIIDGEVVERWTDLKN